MTEAAIAWVGFNDAWLMVDWIGTHLSERKHRLLAVACCRRIDELILHFPQALRAVVLAERIADGGPVTIEAMTLRRDMPERAFLWIDGYRQEKKNNLMYHAGNAAANCLAGIPAPPNSWAGSYGGRLEQAVQDTSYLVAHSRRRDDREALRSQHLDEQRRTLVPLVRCVSGNPFHPSPFSPTWRTEAVVGLARGMYESRGFGPMPVLADALEDAGCADAAILTHCRGDGPHVRGCWVVDLVLGKE
ncbi:hypothetical protein [Urbifossiella limnaea]|uniref:hypothetical protein n=1 Tax=Urbifossiella limnaea TaxID=2528023 RepID=UPI001EE49CCF|nr:hypothetical protein [Urbifossiella limnaea]